MSARCLSTLALGALACTYVPTGKDSTSTGDDDDADPTPSYTEPGDDDDSDPGDSSGRPTAGFDVKYLVVEADLGFDASINSIVEVQLAGGSAPPAIYFLLGTETWKASGFDLALDAEFCYVILPLTSSASAPWALADPTVWYGVDYVGGVTGVLSNCDTPDHEVADSLFGPDIPWTLLNTYGGWGAGVGEWGASIYAYYDPATTTNGFFDMFVGARIQNNGFAAPDDFYAFPVAIDPVTYQASITGGYYAGVPAADIPTGTGVATAWYRIFGVFYYVF